MLSIQSIKSVPSIASHRVDPVKNLSAPFETASKNTPQPWRPLRPWRFNPSTPKPRTPHLATNPPMNDFHANYSASLAVFQFEPLRYIYRKTMAGSNRIRPNTSEHQQGFPSSIQSIESIPSIASHRVDPVKTISAPFETAIKNTPQPWRPSRPWRLRYSLSIAPPCHPTAFYPS